MYLGPTSNLILVEKIHMASHEGVRKTLLRVRALFFWQQMRKLVQEVSQECQTCQ